MHIYYIRSRYLLSFCYCLERVCHGVFGFTRPSFAYHYASHWCSLCPSSLALSCLVASQFPLATVSDCQDILRVFSLPYFSTRHSVAPHNIQYSPFHFRWLVWNIFFCFSVSDHVWASIIGQGIYSDSRTSFFISRFLTLPASIKPRLFHSYQAISFLFFIVRNLRRTVSEPAGGLETHQMLMMKMIIIRIIITIKAGMLVYAQTYLCQPQSITWLTF